MIYFELLFIKEIMSLSRFFLFLFFQYFFSFLFPFMYGDSIVRTIFVEKTIPFSVKFSLPIYLRSIHYICMSVLWSFAFYSTDLYIYSFWQKSLCLDYYSLITSQSHVGPAHQRCSSSPLLCWIISVFCFPPNL